MGNSPIKAATLKLRHTLTSSQDVTVDSLSELIFDEQFTKTCSSQHMPVTLLI